MTRFYEYLEKLRDPHYKTAIKISWLYPDETVQKEFTNDLYNMSGNLTVNYQNGARRSCTITLSNDNGKFPVDYDNIWLGQKFQLWMGLYLNDGTPFYLPQGIFYIKNPKETYNPNTKTLTLQGVDKWAYLDGSLFGYLRGTYQSLVNQDIRGLVAGLINKSKYDNNFDSTSNILDRIDPKDALFDGFNGDNSTAEVQAYDTKTGNLVFKDNSSDAYFIIGSSIGSDGKVTNPFYKCTRTEIKADDDTLISYSYTSKETAEKDFSPTNYEPAVAEQSIFLNPYTMTTETGKTLADMILEYATILFADVYYDENGYLRFVARDRSKQDQSVYNKELIWHFTVEEKELLGLELTNAFDKVYNDIIVLGQIIGGKQMKARIQNQDPASDTNVEKIGIKTKPPYESDQYYSNQLCLELAGYYAQIDMAMDRTGTVKALPIYHMDVNKLITLSTPNNKMKREEFLVTGYTLPLNPIGQMSLNVTNLKYFTNWTDMTWTLEEGVVNVE
jgi:hypothetical protein